MRLTRIRGHYLWTVPLAGQSVVIDAGAHRGEFSAEIMTRFGCQCHLIEANPMLAEKLSVPGAASITNAALAARDGRTTFHNNDNPEGGSIVPNGAPISKSASGLPDAARRADWEIGAPTAVEVETISLPRFMERIGVEKIDLLKLDIEGAEFDLIASTPESVLRRVNQITVEFHDFQARFAGQRLFESARARLKALGFICCVMSFRTNGDVLFLNRERLRLGAMQSAYASGLARLVEKTKVLCSSN